MNLYQTLNQDLRAFRMKQSLLEAEEVKPEVNEEVTTETEEAPVEECTKTEAENSDEIIALEDRVNEIDERLKGIDDSLANAADDEKEELLAERNELVNELNGIEAQLRGDSEEPKVEGDCCDCCDHDDAEVVEEVPTEEIIEEVPTEEPAEDLKDAEGSPIEVVDFLISVLEDEKSIDPELALTKLKELKELLAPKVETEVEEVPAEELTECEVKSFKVVRMAPSSNVFMIEAQTTEGIRYITGRNYNEAEKTLDEAEIAENKGAAANRFKSLLANK